MARRSSKCDAYWPRTGYVVCDVDVRGCLHLKSAVTALTDDTLLVNPAWLDRGAFSDFELVETDPGEAMAANALRLHDRVVYPTAFPRTAERLASRGFAPRAGRCERAGEGRGGRHVLLRVDQ
jgi:dimethylargininase